MTIYLHVACYWAYYTKSVSRRDNVHQDSYQSLPIWLSSIQVSWVQIIRLYINWYTDIFIDKLYQFTLYQFTLYQLCHLAQIVFMVILSKMQPTFAFLFPKLFIFNSY